MRIPSAAGLATLALCSCNSQAPQPQTTNVINITREDVAAPQGALEPGNNTATAAANNAVAEAGNKAERPSPADVVALYGNHLHDKNFEEAYALWDPNSRPATEQAFEKQFAGLKTIDAAVGKVGRIEGAAGSLYSDIQLTLSGNRDNGDPYVMTGPVTLRRVNDVPGSTAEQRRWHIVKTKLTSNPKAAEKLVTQ